MKWIDWWAQRKQWVNGLYFHSRCDILPSLCGEGTIRVIVYLKCCYSLCKSNLKFLNVIQRKMFRTNSVSLLLRWRQFNMSHMNVPIYNSTLLWNLGHCQYNPQASDRNAGILQQSRENKRFSYSRKVRYQEKYWGFSLLWEHGNQSISLHSRKICRKD